MIAKDGQILNTMNGSNALRIFVFPHHAFITTLAVKAIINNLFELVLNSTKFLLSKTLMKHLLHLRNFSLPLSNTKLNLNER